MSLILSPDTVTTSDGPGRVCRILVVDNHQLFREGLHALLAREREFVVVGDAREGNEALELIALHQPDVVITELHLGAGSSVRHLEEIRRRFPKVAILVLTEFRARDVAARVRRAGALGYLLKEQGISELLTALREVASGSCYRSNSRAVARGLAASEEGAQDARVVDLTERQRQVLRLVALGYRAREIAQMLGVSVKAVHKQCERIREVLQLDSTAALTRFAAREGVAQESDASR
jgi:DNA-binding NarL/FixJ family response regulator